MEEGKDSLMKNEEKKCEALVPYEPKSLLKADESRQELEDALERGVVREPFSIGTWLAIGISAALSATSSPMARLLTPKKPSRC
jgi:hypothetical protein